MPALSVTSVNSIGPDGRAPCSCAGACCDCSCVVWSGSVALTVDSWVASFLQPARIKRKKRRTQIVRGNRIFNCLFARLRLVCGVSAEEFQLMPLLFQ